MKIRVEKFCSLATARDWQTWLYNHDPILYQEFITKLRHAKGCNDNRRLMVDILGVIDQRGDSVKLSEFLRLHYPHLILDNKVVVDGSEFDRIFSQNILSFPHRKILFGDNKELPRIIEEFLSDKINCEFLIADGRAYIEYLNSGEEYLVASIPNKNWLIKAKRDEQDRKT